MHWLDDEKWNGLLEDLRLGRVPSDSIHTAMVRLAKPFDEQRIRKAAQVVAHYLNHDDPWVRHETVWFLASWGRLLEYEPQVVEMMLHDAWEDNRGFAANCLGILKARHSDRHTLAALRTAVLNEQETEQVRVKAYAAMRNVVGADASMSSADSFDFEIGNKHLQDIDWNWVRTSSPVDC